MVSNELIWYKSFFLFILHVSYILTTQRMHATQRMQLHHCPVHALQTALSVDFSFKHKHVISIIKQARFPDYGWKRNLPTKQNSLHPNPTIGTL